MKADLKSLMVVFLTSIFFFPFSACTTPGAGKIPAPPSLLAHQRGFPLFQNLKTPFSYPSLTRMDINELLNENEIIEVEGTSASFLIYFPISFRGALDPTGGSKIEFGDRSIDQAISDAMERYHVDYVFDVRIDLNLVTYLILYNKITMVIHGKGIRLKTNPIEAKKP